MIHFSSGKAIICTRTQLESKKLRDILKRRKLKSPQIQMFAIYLYYIIVMWRYWTPVQNNSTQIKWFWEAILYLSIACKRSQELGHPRHILEFWSLLKTEKILYTELVWHGLTYKVIQFIFDTRKAFWHCSIENLRFFTECPLDHMTPKYRFKNMYHVYNAFFEPNEWEHSFSLVFIILSL